MKKFITEDLAGDLEAIFAEETYYGQDGNLYSCVEGKNNILAYVKPNTKDADGVILDWSVEVV